MQKLKQIIASLILCVSLTISTIQADGEIPDLGASAEGTSEGGIPEGEGSEGEGSEGEGSERESTDPGSSGISYDSGAASSDDSALIDTANE
jgi:hypothetical protein